MKIIKWHRYRREIFRLIIGLGVTLLPTLGFSIYLSFFASPETRHHVDRVLDNLTRDAPEQ